MLDGARIVEPAAAALIGASVGAFAATAAIRLSEQRNPWRGRSQCDGCKRGLSIVETVPLLSHMMSQGRCRTCDARIDLLHSLGEGLGLVLAPLCLLLRPGLDGVMLAMLGLLLLTTALVDLRTYRLLDIFTIPIGGLSALIAWRQHQLVEGGMAAALSAVVLVGVKIALEHRSKRAMLGYGDIKLISALALALADQTPAMLIIATGMGLVARWFQKVKPYGPAPFGPCLFAGFITIAIVKNILPSFGA